MHKNGNARTMMQRERKEEGSCRALGTSAAALILHYGLGAMKKLLRLQRGEKTSARCKKPPKAWVTKSEEQRGRYLDECSQSLCSCSWFLPVLNCLICAVPTILSFFGGDNVRYYTANEMCRNWTEADAKSHRNNFSSGLIDFKRVNSC